MPGIRTDLWDTVGGVFMVILGLGCAGWGGRALLRPHRPEQPITGPAWAVRSWGLGYVLLGTALAVRMAGLLVGAEPAWPMAVIQWAATPLLVCSVAAALVSRRRTRHRAGRAGRHKTGGTTTRVL
ncbi:hypothetical protein SLA_3780 [Streptomyces laurentii]|uniref:Uncharacterized protein n=1 Tax=Streptomyces laurentii TaxID=39478 RepID=A0A160P1X5_STRLU|nr:hypothetical protein SLA_3780 [Streptomyces laurentii]